MKTTYFKSYISIILLMIMAGCSSESGEELALRPCTTCDPKVTILADDGMSQLTVKGEGEYNHYTIRTYSTSTIISEIGVGIENYQVVAGVSIEPKGDFIEGDVTLKIGLRPSVQGDLFLYRYNESSNAFEFRDYLWRKDADGLAVYTGIKVTGDFLVAQTRVGEIERIYE